MELFGFMFTTLREKDIEVVERWVALGIFKEEGYEKGKDWELGMGVVNGK